MKAGLTQGKIVELLIYMFGVCPNFCPILFLPILVSKSLVLSPPYPRIILNCGPMFSIFFPSNLATQ